MRARLPFLRRRRHGPGHYPPGPLRELAAAPPPPSRTPVGQVELLALDLETTGLDPNDDHIVEIAWQLTTTSLVELSPLRTHVIQPNGMTFGKLETAPFVKNMHVDSGLYEDLLRPSRTLRLDVTERTVLLDISEHVLPEGTVQLAGASVHFDKGFLRTWMPSLHDRLHHRIYDTSTLKTFFEEVEVIHGVENEGQHRAANDVREVLEVARRYRTWVKDLKGFAEAVTEIGRL